MKKKNSVVFESIHEYVLRIGRDPGLVSLVCCSHSQQTEGVLLHVFPGSQEDGSVHAIFGSPHLKSMPYPHNIPYANHRAVTGTDSAGRLVHHRRLEGHILS